MDGSTIAEAAGTGRGRAEARAAAFAVGGMTCGGCAARLERALDATPGVASASVNFAARRAAVTLSPDGDWGAVERAVRDAGYQATLTEASFAVSGLRCAGCVGRLEAALATAPRVREVSVNLATGRAAVRSLGPTPRGAVAAAARKAGYPIVEDQVRGAGDEAASSETASTGRRAALAGLATAPLVVLEMGGHASSAFGAWTGAALGGLAGWLAFALASVALFGPGRAFFVDGARALARGAPDMNSLVMLGAGAAWAYSTVALIAAGPTPEAAAHVYFESGAVIVTLILLGRWLEGRARGRAGAAIRTLIALQPATALVVREGVAAETPVAALEVGDLVLLRPGARAPVDGVATEGESWIDESMVTGEPAPVRKVPGDAVTGGTVNGAGALTFRAERVGADTLLASIVAMVEAAQGAKLPIQSLVNRVTLWFVPAILVVAALTLGFWLWAAPEQALSHAVAVLIVACPCAMGLATPISIVVGTGRGAELGVLFRRGAALQGLRDVEVAAFDKTGTLTEGRPAVTETTALDGDAAALLAQAAAVEALSEHPVARAVCEAAQAQGLVPAPAGGFRAETGRGVSAEVAGRTVVVGSARMLREAGVDVAPLSAAAARADEAGATAICVAIDGRPAGLIAVADPIKPGAAAALAELKALGLDLVMVTGDAEGAARAVARQLGLETVHAGALPAEKAGVVAALQKSGRRVVFIGDGVNDAPALAQADVGAAIGAGTDIAIESADVVLMAEDLSAAAKAVRLSRATMANIRQNLVWAFGYNAALIPVAAGALAPWGVTLSPMLAGAAMALSSVSVVANALRLRRAG